MNIATLDKTQLRALIRSAIAIKAGGVTASNAEKAGVCAAILGITPSQATATGTMDDLRNRATILLGKMSESQRGRIAADMGNNGESIHSEGEAQDGEGFDAMASAAPDLSQQAPAAPANDAMALFASLAALPKQVGDLSAKMATANRAIVELHDRSKDMFEALDTKITAAAGAMDESKVASIVEDGIRDLRAENNALRDKLESLLSQAASSPKLRAAVVANATRHASPLLTRLEGLYSPGQYQGNVAALLLSPPGLGKSYWVRVMGAQYDAIIEHGCSPDSEEINTLKGGATVRDDGSFLVYDGKVTQAVRMAAAGRNVLLFLDEVLRLAPKAQEALLTFMTGVKDASGSLRYQWTTRQVDSSGCLEVIECPAENLHIIAAANLNMPPNEAFLSRWLAVRIPYDEATVRITAQAMLDGAGFATSNLAARFAAALTLSRSLAASGAIKYPLTCRHVEKAITLAQLRGKSGENELAEIAADFVPDAAMDWDARTGDAIAQSMASCERIAAVIRGTESIS